MQQFVSLTSMNVIRHLSQGIPRLRTILQAGPGYKSASHGNICSALSRQRILTPMLVFEMALFRSQAGAAVQYAISSIIKYSLCLGPKRSVGERRKEGVRQLERSGNWVLMGAQNFVCEMSRVRVDDFTTPRFGFGTSTWPDRVIKIDAAFSECKSNLCPHASVTQYLFRKIKGKNCCQTCAFFYRAENSFNRSYLNNIHVSQ